ncbi:hypothetical protein cypCar_00010038 [Cyprinus carpio]|nr:hypothetical protein cypCar_00010038 [Cyprinus carpio]
MRHASTSNETMENSSLTMTNLFKICTQCERLSKKDVGVRIPRLVGNGPSRFIPEKEILQVSKLNERIQSIFEDAFAVLGRLDNISLVMGFHPQYLESFLKTLHYLLQMDGPLSLHCRHYIGIMAAARHQCTYLVNLHVNDFLHVGGDPKWLNGLEEAPQKLRALGELNKILAHRPWLLTKEHIEVSFFLCLLHGRYDDYDYGEINQLLDRSFKVYIKTMVRTPEKITKRMYDSFWRQFQHSEKVHVNLLLMEARMQAELLYALRAITRYMT